MGQVVAKMNRSHILIPFASISLILFLWLFTGCRNIPQKEFGDGEIRVALGKGFLPERPYQIWIDELALERIWNKADFGKLLGTNNLSFIVISTVCSEERSEEIAKSYQVKLQPERMLSPVVIDFLATRQSFATSNEIYDIQHNGNWKGIVWGSCRFITPFGLDAKLLFIIQKKHNEGELMEIVIPKKGTNDMTGGLPVYRNPKYIPDQEYKPQWDGISN